ncbi:MAG: J domain-containing protein [Clostridia bacterium]|nr:J domain-containing protein [Clostridia bacterium]
MIFKDYYKILGLDTNRVSKEQIKTAYREQAKRYHPDVNIGNRNSEERFKDINEAYRILADTSTKRKYDRIWTRNVTTKRSSYSNNAKNDFFTMLFGIIPEDNIIKKQNKVPCKGENLETEVKIKLSEAYNGTTKSVSLRSVNGNVKILKIEIPAGIKNNDKIRIIGQGKPGSYGGKNGDLYIRVKILDDKNLRLIGNDLKTYINILPWEAVLGTKIKIKSINEEILVHIPSGTNSGQVITIENKGYRYKDGNRGNLILEVRIEIPKDSTEREKQLYGELKKISKINVRKS